MTDSPAADVAPAPSAAPSAGGGAGSPPPPRRRRLFARLVLYGVMVPWVLYTMLAAYVRLTRLPDLDNDLSALLPRGATHLYAELPSPRDLLPAVAGTSTMRAFTSTDARGRVVAPREVPGDDERSLRRADRQARMFRMMTSMMPTVFDRPVVYAIVRWPGEATVVQYFLTRSEPTVARQVMPMFALLMPGMTTTSAVHRDVPHTLMVKLDEEEGDEAIQYVQLGDVFAVAMGSDDPVHVTRLIDAWYRDDRRRSHYADVVAARARIEAARPAPPLPAVVPAAGASPDAAASGDAGREWLFVTIAAPGFVAAALDVAAGLLDAGDENDALDWIAYAEWADRLGSCALVAREAAGGASGAAGLELAGVFSPPGRLEPAPARQGAQSGAGGRFAMEATSARAAGWLLQLVLPAAASREELKDAARERLDELRRRAGSAPDDAPLHFEAAGDVAPPLLAGTFAPAAGGAAVLAPLREALAAQGLSPREHVVATAAGAALRWPDPSAAEPARTAREWPGAPFPPLAGEELARLRVAAGDLDDEAFHAFALALTRDVERARSRRAAIQFLAFLHDAAAWELRASLGRGGEVLAVLRATPRAASAGEAAPAVGAPR